MNKLVFTSIIVVLACSAFTQVLADTVNRSFSLAYERVYPSLSFKQPTLLMQQPGDKSRFYVLEKSGKAYWFENHKETNTKHLYLDLSSKVDESYEGGLLGMAFDPDFENNRFVYLSYTTSTNPEMDNSKQLVSRISRFTTDLDNQKLLTSSERVLFSLSQPYNNHNGGHIAFGPDGYLYAGYGDGGSWGDPHGNAQNTATLLGSMLRVDVTDLGDETEGVTYRVPADNPFASSSCTQAGCPEIYAWGMRNPWRWSFDRETGQLWVGDVGQGEFEEINIVKKGGNYGWNCREGNADYRPQFCGEISLQSPVIDYSHLANETSRDGRAASVTGGYVYRGKKIPQLYGHYIYADFVHGLIWALSDPYGQEPESVQIFDTDIMIVTFAQDNDGELYFLNYVGDGGIYRFVPTPD